MPGSTHIVIGDGITAAALIGARPFEAGDRLIVVGRNAAQLGRGVAYAADPVDAPWRYAYLLNSPADDIDPAFARWLADRWDNVEAAMQGRSPDWLGHAQGLVAQGDLYGLNAPREMYGDFMQEHVTALLSGLRTKGVSVDLITANATGLVPHEGGLQVALDTGQVPAADSVDVAPGGPATLRLPGDYGPYAAPTVFGHEERILDHIRAGAEIFCIGGNAAMLDVLRLCQCVLPDDKIRLTACAPDGEAPPPLIPRLPRKMTRPQLKDGHLSAESFLDDVRQAIATARAEGDEMREIRAGFRAYFLDHGLLRHVPDPTMARRVAGTLRLWLRGGTRDTILDFQRLAQTGQTRILSGLVTGIDHHAEGAVVHIRDLQGQTRQQRAGFVVNCAGAGATSRYDAVTEQMLAEGWLQTCTVSRGLEVGARCLTALPGLRHLSPATSVIDGEPMAMPMYDAHMLRVWADRAYA